MSIPGEKNLYLLKEKKRPIAARNILNIRINDKHYFVHLLHIR